MYSVPPSYSTPPLAPMPMSLSQILDESIRLYKRHFAVFFSVTLLMAIPGLLLTLILSTSTLQQEFAVQIEQFQRSLADAERLGDPSAVDLRDLLEGLMPLMGRVLILAMGIALVNGYLFQTLTVGATTATIIDSYADRVPTTAGVLNTAFQRLGTLIVWALLLGAIVLGPYFLIGFAMIGQSFELLFCLALLAIAWFFTSVYLLVRLIFGSRVIVAEGTGVGAAFRRSMELSRGSFWRIVGFGLALGLLVAVGSGLIGMAIDFLLGAALGAGTASFVASTIISSVIGAVFAPILNIGLTLLYFDRRRQREVAPPQYGVGQGYR